MSHPEFFEPTFDVYQAPRQAGIAKGGEPFAWGVGLCPTSLSLSRRLRRREKKGKKAFFGDTWGRPNWGPASPGRDAALPALSLFECLFQTFGVTHDFTFWRDNCVGRKKFQESNFFFHREEGVS